MKKLLALVLAVSLMAVVLSGCKKEQSVAISSNLLKIDFSQYKDSEDIPDWDGEQLSIVKWVQATNPNATTLKSFNLKDDPITKEIKRVTGVDYNLDESFDNAGSSFDAVVAKLIATNSFPHVAEGIPNVLSLIENEYLWDIGDYVKEYAPTVYKMFGPESNTLYGDLWKRQEKKYGGVYELAIASSVAPMRQMAEAGFIDVTDEQLDAFCIPLSAYPTVSIREDILKKLYPDAHTNAELEAIFDKNGAFTEEEIFDVPLNSPQDFIDMLYKIRDMKLKDGSNDVYATFTHTGMDNWPACQQLGAMFGKVSALNPSASYFQYFDKNTNEIKSTIKQPWFKDMLKMYNKLIRDGVASEEAMVDTSNVCKEKLNNGNYIVCYGSYIPNENALRDEFSYRKVYAKYKTDTENTLYVGNDYTTYNRYTFFKNSLSEEQLVQVLRMFEFLVSDAGEKLCFWGTKSMGLYTEDADGNLQYKDETIKNEMINPETYGNEHIISLGLEPKAWPGRIVNYTSKYYPKFAYTEDVKTWDKMFNASFIDALETTPGMQPMIYSDAFLSQFEAAKNFWNARNGFEDAMIRVFAAGSDKEFEEKYAAMVSYAESKGLTDDFYRQATKWYLEEYNKDYAGYIKK